MASVDTSDPVSSLPKDDGMQVDCSLISVTKVNGSEIQCNMAADSTVQDLLDAVAYDDKEVAVDKAHALLLDPILVLETGAVMENGLKLSDYGLTSDSKVTIVKQRVINGSYTCWVQVDTSAPLSANGLEKFTLDIKGRVVSLNGVEGTINADVGTGARVSARFSEPITIKSTVPNSKALFQATGCEIQCRSGNFSSPWWYHIDGKLIGTSVTYGIMKSSGNFKGRISAASTL